VGGSDQIHNISVSEQTTRAQIACDDRRMVRV
jgi:hypothetical protein